MQKDISGKNFINTGQKPGGACQTVEYASHDDVFQAVKKEMGKGTGMELSIVHGIVKSYGGFITCYSQPGEVTVFHVYLPIIPREDIILPERKTALPTGTENILFVDEKMITQRSSDLLQNLGYKALAVTDSKQTLTIFQEEPADLTWLSPTRPCHRLPGPIWLVPCWKSDRTSQSFSAPDTAPS